MLVHNKEVRFLLCFWKAGENMSVASEEIPKKHLLCLAGIKANRD